MLLLAVVMLFCAVPSFAQPDLPQRTITVTAIQLLHFGTFCVSGSGGTVVVGYDGTRTATGGVSLISASPTAQPAIFEVKICPGRNVVITYDATAILTGSSGGTLTMDIGPTEKGPSGSTFTTTADCNFVTPIRVGGTLHVPAGATSGTYEGTFSITFNRE